MATLTAPKLGGTGTVELSEDRFSADWNDHLVWHVVRNELAWRRQGTHATRTRGQVRGGGAKPWRQKGTGRARQGTRSAPQWRGGGVVFGPHPHSHGGKVNRKERLAALRAALSAHQSRGSLAILADDALATASTKAAVKLRNDFTKGDRAGKITVVCTLEQESVWKSFRNLPDVQIVPVGDLDVADVLWGSSLFVSEAALVVLEGKAGQ